MTHTKGIAIILVLFASCGLALGGPPQDLVSMLDKTGYHYTKIDKGIWEIEFTGKNLKEFPVRVIQADDLTILMTKLADRKDLVKRDALFVKLLELNDSMDNIKFALSKDMLYGRIEIHTKVLTDNELKYLLEQMSGAIDQAYPDIKPYLGAQ